MEKKIVHIPADILEKFMYDVFVHLGVPEEDARISAEILITSDLRGIESHGIGRLKLYFDRINEGIQLPKTTFEIVRQSPTTAVVDGHDGMGQVIGYRAMHLAIQKAKEFGMGSVAVRNSAHYGIAGYYPLMAIKAGMIGLSVTNARPSIAPTFGTKPMLGTNPIAFGAPTDEKCPFLFDAATSITQRGKLEVLARLEKPTPVGWVEDPLGNPLTDTNKILSGFAKDAAALLPLGGQGEGLAGYKGYGLATMVEILSASLQAGSFLWGLSGIGENGEKLPNRLGHFFMAINIEAFLPLDEFKQTTGEILRQLRSSRKQPGFERIFTAGEKEFENEIRIRKEGVPVVPNLQKDILLMQKELGLSNYRFDF
jgi:LDH2 family malate/lactate/ureidoglycolate dehydrogenase